MYVPPVKRAGTESPLDLSRKRRESLMLERHHPLTSLFFKNGGGPQYRRLVYPCSNCFYQGAPCPLHALTNKTPEPPPHAPANGLLLHSSGSEPDLVAPPCLEAVPPEGPPSTSPALSPPQLTAAVPPMQVINRPRNGSLPSLSSRERQTSTRLSIMESVAMHKLDELDTSQRKKKHKKKEIEEDQEVEEEEEEEAKSSPNKDDQHHHYRTRVNTKKRLCQKFVYKRYNKNAAYEEELLKEARHLSELRARKRLRRRRLERQHRQDLDSSEIPEAAEEGDDEATPKPAHPVRRRRMHHRRSGLDMINQRKRKPAAARPSDTPRVRTVRDPGGGDVKKVIVNKALGETVLHRAARQGHLGLVESCLRTGMGSVGARDNAGFTPLHEACGRRASDRTHLAVARCLLQHGADPNAASANGGIRPLHDAVENGHVELTRLLLSYGADPSLATYAGYTPLRLARSMAMGALLQAYMADCNGEPSPIWQFRGSSSCFDPESSGFHVLDDLPSDVEPTEGDDLVFEISERPHLPSFRLQLPGHSLASNCLRLSDVLGQLGEQREEFEAKHPEVPVWDVSRHVFAMGATCSQLLDGHLIDSLLNSGPTGETVSLVVLEGPLQELLDIQTLILR